MRAFAEFVIARPNIFGILGYHTGPAAFLRPPYIARRQIARRIRRRKMEELGAVAKRHTGLPCVPVYRYCAKKDRGAILHGHFPTTAYQHWGLFGFEFELGTILDSAGMDFDAQFSWETNDERHEGERRLMRWWDRRGRKPRIFLPWKRFNHPQLGPVEIGGRVFSVWAGMTMSDLKKRCAATYKFTLHHAAQHPDVGIRDVEAKNLGAGVWRIPRARRQPGRLPDPHHQPRRQTQPPAPRPRRIPPRPRRRTPLPGRPPGHRPSPRPRRLPPPRVVRPRPKTRRLPHRGQRRHRRKFRRHRQPGALISP